MEKINEKKIFAVSCSWGGDEPGVESYIVTEKGELYYYEKQAKFTVDTEGNFNSLNETKNIKLIKKLNEKEYHQILDFIKNNIVGKQFASNIIFDAGYTVIAEYDNEKYTIKDSAEKLYNPAYELIKSLLDNIKE